MLFLKSCLALAVDDVEVKLNQKGPNQFGSKFHEIPILVTIFVVFQRPYVCNVLGWSVRLS